MMSLLEIFASTEARPFSVAIGVVLGLFALEVLSLLVGFSLLGAGESPEVEVEAEIDTGTDASFLSLLGLGFVPFGVWLVIFLTSFSLLGFAAQSLSLLILDRLLSAPASAFGVLIPSVLTTRMLCRAFSRILPGVSSEAVSENSFGSLRGVVTNGVSKNGLPARVRIQDKFGKTQYVMAEPLSALDEIGEGSEVLVFRDRRQRNYKILQIND